MKIRKFTEGASTLCILHVSCLSVCAFQVHEYLLLSWHSLFLHTYSKSPIRCGLCIADHDRISLSYLFFSLPLCGSSWLLHPSLISILVPAHSTAASKCVQNINDIYIGYGIRRNACSGPFLLPLSYVSTFWVIKLQHTYIPKQQHTQLRQNYLYH